MTHRLLAAARPHWRTALGAAVGGVGGALYAVLVGCQAGTCAITSDPWRAALFFGVTGAIVGMPGPREEAAPSPPQPEPRG